MKKLASKRKETEHAARQLDALRKRATPKERVSPAQAIQIANLNIFERGEIVDYKDIYFCGTQNAAKHVGDLHSEAANFGYDDERGDYTIVLGDHLCYRYEIVDILGKGSFGQVVRCIDHKTGVLVAVKDHTEQEKVSPAGLSRGQHPTEAARLGKFDYLSDWQVTDGGYRIPKTNIAW